MVIRNRIPKVHQDKCVGCRNCEVHCPTGAIKVRAGNNEGYVAPCSNACPAGIDVTGYIALAAAGRYEDAYRLIRQNNPFPSVCGRICTHPCQLECNRCNYDSSVAIRDIKRFVSDYAFERGVKKENVWPANGKKVAVIGAGPSGLSCAYYLALSGYAVNVYESAPFAGGILALGIPRWRLPMEVIQREVQVVEDAGVQIHLNCEVGRDVTFDALQQDNDAVYIATGTQFSRKAGVVGEDLPGVTHGLDFLREVNLGSAPDYTGKKVVVIGGGNTAMDASRTALRLGAEQVTVVYRRREVDMPADMREVMEAKEEGVKFVTLAAPKAFEGDGKVEKVVCTRMKLGEKDAKGRTSTVPTDQEIAVDADVVIVAVSQYSDFPFISKDEVEMTEWGKLSVNDEMMTTLPGVFAGGDVARGSATAIQAIADGKNAAAKIAAYLGLEVQINRGAEIELPPRGEKISYKAAGPMRNAPVEERVRTSEEVALGLSEEMLQEAAARCYRCAGKAVVDEDKCVDCGLCWEHCNYKAIEMEILEQPIIRPPMPVMEEELYPAMHDIMKKAKVMPELAICVCSLTTVWEVVYAILKGAHTPEELSTATGVRSGCSIYCIDFVCNLLDAAGYPPQEPESGVWHWGKTTLTNLTEAQAVQDPHVNLKKSQELWWTEEAFEQAWQAFLAKQAGMKEKMKEAMKNGQH